MSDNALICIVCFVAIAGCSTCHVSGDYRQIQLEKIKAGERIKLIELQTTDTP